MGKFLVFVSGVEKSGNVAATVFYSDDDSGETIDACIDLFNESYSIDKNRGLDVDTLDVVDLCENFNLYGDLDRQAIGMSKQRLRKEEEEERELLANLKAKYEGK